MDLPSIETKLEYSRCPQDTAEMRDIVVRLDPDRDRLHVSGKDSIFGMDGHFSVPLSDIAKLLRENL